MRVTVRADIQADNSMVGKAKLADSPFRLAKAAAGMARDVESINRPHHLHCETDY